MNYRIKGTTSPPITFRLLAVDGSPVTGLGTAPVVQVSKNGGAYATSSGTVAELSAGEYAFTPAAADVNTAGTLHLTMTGTGAVVAYEELVILESTGVLPTGYAPPAYTPISELPDDPNADNIYIWKGV